MADGENKHTGSTSKDVFHISVSDYWWQPINENHNSTEDTYHFSLCVSLTHSYIDKSWVIQFCLARSHRLTKVELLSKERIETGC